MHTLRSTNDHDDVVYTRAVTIRFDPLDVLKLKYSEPQKNASPILTSIISAGLVSVGPGFSLLIPIVSIGRDRRLLLRLVVGVLDVYCSSPRIVIIHLLPRSYGTGASWLAGRGTGLAPVAYRC